MVLQQACKLASSTATMNYKLASSMIMMHQQAGNNHMSKTLNPSAKPFVPLQQNYHSIPSSLPSHNFLYAATPLLPPNIYQPYVQYFYQPCLIQHQPQPHYHAANFYNPSSFVFPQFFGHVAPCSVSDTRSHSSASGTPLRANILNQIEYYFSDENLRHDCYLISLMDDKGWIPISVIANFNRVKAMCRSIPFILDSLVDSSIVEVKGDKIRRRDEWSKWIPSAVITKQIEKASPVEQQPGLKIVPQETTNVGNNNTSGVSERISTPITTLPAQQGKVDAANKSTLDASVNEIECIVNLDGQTEARADCNKTIAANPIHTEPTKATPTNQQGQVETMSPSPPLNYRQDMVEKKGHSESSIVSITITC